MEEEQTYFQKNKKELIIIGLICLVFLIVVGVIFFLKSKNNTDTKGGTITSKSSNSLYSKNSNQNSNSDENGNNDSNNSGNYDYYQEGLIKIWDKPVAGYGFYTKKDTYDNILIFVDSGTGYIYEKNLNQPTSSPTQITKTEYPNIREAYFLIINEEKKVLLQYSANNNIKTILATIPDYYGTEKDLENVNDLDNNITNVSISPDFSKAVYVLTKNKTTNNKKDLISDLFLIDNNGRNKIYSSDLSSWKTQINNSGEIFVYNNETSKEKNGLYKLDIYQRKLNNIYQGHTGSSYLINNNSILISSFTDNGIKLYKNANFYGDTFTDNNLFDLKLKTLTNKCSLGDNIICAVPKEIKNYDSGLPDAWYQGATSWDDNLYIFNEEYPLGQLLFDMKTDGQVDGFFDLKDIKITKDNNRVLFINKNNGELWSLYIGNISNQYIGD